MPLDETNPSRRIDKDRINNHLRLLEQYVGNLEKIKTGGRENFLENSLLQTAAERYLQISIETLLNIGNHIIAARGLKAPEEYADIFRILAEDGIFPKSEVLTFTTMTRFRNRLVHVYWAIDPEQVWEIIENRLNDFYRFEKAILPLVRE